MTKTPLRRTLAAVLATALMSGAMLLGGAMSAQASGAVHGQVIDPASSGPIAQVHVQAFLDVSGTWTQQGGDAVTDASGLYSFPSLPAGSYRFTADGTLTDHVVAYSGNVYFPDQAVQHVLADGADLAIDFSLPLGATINGHISVSDGSVPSGDAFPSPLLERSPGVWQMPELIGGSGDNTVFHFTWLPPGTYRVSFIDGHPETLPNYDTQYWNDRPTLETADDIVAAPGSTTNGIDAVLTYGAPSPLSTGAVTVTGVHQLGQTLTAHPGTWGPGTVTLGFEWLRDGTPISGATSDSYLLGAADVDHVVTARVTGARPGYTTASASSSATPAVYPVFADVATGSQFSADTTWMFDQAISTGYVDGDGVRSYHPLDTVTRRAMAAFLYRAAGSPSFVAPTTPSFTDVPTSDPFFSQIEWMKAQGISTGTGNGDGTFAFKPADAVSRQAMALFLYRFAGSPAFTPPVTPLFTDVPTTAGSYAQIEWMKAQAISTGTGNGDGTFSYKPLAAVSRQAMAAFLHRAVG